MLKFQVADDAFERERSFFARECELFTYGQGKIRETEKYVNNCEPMQPLLSSSEKVVSSHLNSENHHGNP